MNWLDLYVNLSVWTELFELFAMIAMIGQKQENDIGLAILFDLNGRKDTNTFAFVTRVKSARKRVPSGSRMNWFISVLFIYDTSKFDI